MPSNSTHMMVYFVALVACDGTVTSDSEVKIVVVGYI